MNMDHLRFTMEKMTQAHLEINGETFKGTYHTEDKEAAEKRAKEIGGVVKDFFVNIKEANPTTLEVIDWERKDGYSVWKAETK